ncbi:hypothetical protein [Streptomyces sp. NPDC096152]|uniref:hypothetical protein n=1 Tax=Streptomyces sp. NPDC096152 TaxID=3366078 RepID=UPI0037F45928
MDIEQCLVTIDLLCGRDFPEQRGRTDRGSAGPGYHTAELAASHGLRAGDGAEREATADDFRAWMELVADRLNGRLGQAEHLGLVTLGVRIARGEEIPEPWALLSHVVRDVYVWPPRRRDRWVALGVADLDDSDEVHLLVAVTDTDPP